MTGSLRLASLLRTQLFVPSRGLSARVIQVSLFGATACGGDVPL
jgi:hypothetical protein